MGDISPYRTRASIAQICVEEDVPYEKVIRYRRQHGCTILEAIEAIREREERADKIEAYLDIAKTNGINRRQWHYRVNVLGLSWEDAATKPVRRYQRRSSNKQMESLRSDNG